MKVIQLILFVVLAVEAFWLYVVNDSSLGILFTLPAGVMLYLLLRDRIQGTRSLSVSGTKGGRLRRGLSLASARTCS